jgi:hypothetical protein
MDFWMYKYNLTCLADGSSWCLMKQKQWFVDYLTTVTWPTYTSKFYPDWASTYPRPPICGCMLCLGMPERACLR